MKKKKANILKNLKILQIKPGQKPVSYMPMRNKLILGSEFEPPRNFTTEYLKIGTFRNLKRSSQSFKPSPICIKINKYANAVIQT